MDARYAASLTLVRALQARWQARLIETHISWVLLDARHAWKIKKPVALSFLDFRELATRRQLTEDECRLNRRLAPELYLGVHALTGTPDQPELDGPGEPIEYVLKMRAFPPGALLSEQLAAGTLTADDLEALAERLADFHAHAPVADAASPWGTPEAITRPVYDLLDGLSAHGEEAACAVLRTWVTQEATRLTAVWQRRRQQGRVIEGHGDLHLANTVRLDSGVTAFDCIEFDPALRWIDGLSDVAFLAMDLMARGRPDLGWVLTNAYLDARGDHEGLPVWRFYLVYRALVRALVDRLRRDQAGSSEGEPDYLALALRLIQAGPAPLLLTHGLSGSGKSVVARALMAHVGAVRLRSDVVRKHLHGLAPRSRDGAGQPALYGEAATRATYARLAVLAEAALQAAYPVIVDATFLAASDRAAFLALARRLGCAVRILHCHAPPAVLRARVAARAAQGRDPSDADLQVLAAQCRQGDDLTAAERALTLDLDTSQAWAVADLAARWLTAPPL